jgi:hypothetical protein
MCKLCDEGIPQHHSTSRRDFLKATAVSGIAAAGAGADLFAPRPAEAHGADVPHDSGRRGRRYIIRGGSVMSMDPAVGDFPEADVLVEGKKILAVGPHLRAGGASVIRSPAAASSCRASSTHTTTRPGRRSEARFPTAS